jgi:hypothetical protein
MSGAASKMEQNKAYTYYWLIRKRFFGFTIYLDMEGPPELRYGHVFVKVFGYGDPGRPDMKSHFFGKITEHRIKTKKAIMVSKLAKKSEKKESLKKMLRTMSKTTYG